MSEPRYADKVKSVINTFDPEGSNRYFLFGSSVRKEHFHDIDLGVIGNKGNDAKIYELKDLFYESDIPYKVDVVDFDSADEGFKEYVMRNEPIVWIK